MRFRDLALLLLICLVWSANQILGRIVVSTLAVEPLFYALTRCVVVSVCLIPVFLSRPRRLARIAGVGVLLSGVSFAANFAGLKFVTPSAAAIVLQLQIPIAALFSVLFLNERIGLKRIYGIALAFLGVVVLLWTPAVFMMSGGLLLILVAAFSSAVGACLIKKIAPVRPLDIQAWGCLVSIPLLASSSAILDTGPVDSAISAGWYFVLAAVGSAVLASIFAHSCYFWLLQRYEANQIVSLTLIHPVMTILMGVALIGDVFTTQMAFGTVITLVGTFIVAIRSKPRPA